jgi:phosphoribosylformylglycinamidine synthase subunit PurS
MRFQARIHVTLKTVVNDPQGLTVRGALHALGFAGVQDVRVGKYLVLALEAADETAAREQVGEMCRKLLANPVIEEFRYEVAAG